MTERQGTRTQRRYRELAYREADGVSVRLLWDSLEDEVLVSVRDHRGGDGFVVVAPRHGALGAFHHPYATRLLDRDPQPAVAHDAVDSPSKPYA
jgi:hypothetical protein